MQTSYFPVGEIAELLFFFSFGLDPFWREVIPNHTRQYPQPRSATPDPRLNGRAISIWRISSMGFYSRNPRTTDKTLLAP